MSPIHPFYINGTLKGGKTSAKTRNFANPQKGLLENMLLSALLTSKEPAVLLCANQEDSMKRTCLNIKRSFGKSVSIFSINEKAGNSRILTSEKLPIVK